MAERIWDRFLTERDRARAASDPVKHKGGGARPAVVLVDLYRWVFGDQPEPLLDSIRAWPGSCGLAGWAALPHIQRLLAEARELGLPVFHVTGSAGAPGWRDLHQRGRGASEDRQRRRFDIVDEVAPISGEIVLHKSSPSAFWGTPLAGLLYGMRVDTVVIAGESTSGCVRATVVDGKSYRFTMIVPEECVFDRDEAPHAINLFDMDQKYADVISLDHVIAYLHATSGDVATTPAAPRQRSARGVNEQSLDRPSDEARAAEVETRLPR